MKNELIPIEVIESKIYLIRGQKVILDIDLAMLYQVSTSMLNRQVRRNVERFPEDFMFQLTRGELDNLMCHFGISSWGGVRKLPLAFTEHGILMLSSVLRSKRAVQVNIQIMRAFVKLRHILSTNKELSQKLKDLEQRYEKHDSEIQAIFDAIRKLMEPPKKNINKIGIVVLVAPTK